MNDGSQKEQIDAWLEEGLRFYSQGDPSRALEAWYRILDVDVGHALAQQYVAYVRQVYRLDAVARPDADPPAPSPAPLPPPAPPPASPVVSPIPDVTVEVKKSRAAEGSWSDLVDSSFDVAISGERTAPRTPSAIAERSATPSGASERSPKMVNPWAAPARKPPEPIQGDPWATPVAAMSTPGVVMPAPAPAVEPPPAPPPLPPRVMTMSGGEERSGPFDPWRGDTVPPLAAPADWSASTESFDIPPTPPPLTAEEIAAAMVPRLASVAGAPTGRADSDAAGRQVDVAIDIDVDMSEPEPAPAPVPAWKQAAVEQVPDVGPRLRSVGGGNRVDVLGPPTSDRTTEWPTGPVVAERVAKQSVRFGDEPLPAPARTPAPIDPAPGKVMDPWDEVGGPGVSLDLDRAAVHDSPLDDVLGHTKAPGGFSTASLHSVTAAAPEDECTALMRGARELFDLGDFSGSLDLVEKVLKLEPNHEGARAYLQRNESTLIKMYESKLGDMRKAPTQMMPPDEVIWMNMHHKAGFLLSQVDGMLSYEDLLEVSGMPRFDTMRILHELVQQGIIG